MILERCLESVKVQNQGFQHLANLDEKTRSSDLYFFDTAYMAVMPTSMKP